MVKCPKCGTQMREVSLLHSKRLPYSAKVEKTPATGHRCPKCGFSRLKETPLQKEKPRESKEMFTQPPQEILSQ